MRKSVGTLCNTAVACVFKNTTMFPYIDNIQQVLVAIQGCQEFRQEEKHGLVFIKYSGAYSSTFPPPDSATTEQEKYNFQVRRECRGIGFYKDTGKIATRKFHKFVREKQTLLTT